MKNSWRMKIVTALFMYGYCFNGSRRYVMTSFIYMFICHAVATTHGRLVKQTTPYEDGVNTAKISTWMVDNILCGITTLMQSQSTKIFCRSSICLNISAVKKYLGCTKVITLGTEIETEVHLSTLSRCKALSSVTCALCWIEDEWPLQIAKGGWNATKK